MKLYFGSYHACPRCDRAETIGRIPRQGWMRAIPGSKHISCLACNMRFMIIGRVFIQAHQPPSDHYEPDVAVLYLKQDSAPPEGPFQMADLMERATAGTLAPEAEVSDDQERWVTAKHIEALEMLWLVADSNGQELGPLNIGAVKVLYQRGDIGHDAAAIHKVTGQKVWVADL